MEIHEEECDRNTWGEHCIEIPGEDWNKNTWSQKEWNRNTLG